MKSENIVITVSRQMTSGGSYIAHSVARKLGFMYVDREILHEAAEFFGTGEKELSGREERLSGWMENMFRIFRYGTPETAYAPPSGPPVYDKDLFETEARIIREIARSGNVVIMGRAGSSILRGHPGLVNVFIHAPLDFRIKRMMAFRHLADEREASAALEESDRTREEFLRAMAGIDWTDARNYHLCLNTGIISFSDAEEMIIRFVEMRRENAGMTEMNFH